MATHSQGTVQVQELLGILRRRKWLLILPAAVGLSLGIMFATMAPRKYVVKTTLELRETNLPIAGRGADARSIYRDVASAIDQIRSMERVRSVVEKLEWRDFAVLDQQDRYEYLLRVLKNITVNTSVPQNSTSSFVFMLYRDSDPVRAEQFLNALRETYVREKVEWVRESARKARDTLQNSVEEAARILTEKSNLSKELKTQYGLSPTQQAPGAGRERTEDPVVLQYYTQRDALLASETRLRDLERNVELLEERLAQAPKMVSQTTKVDGTDFALRLSQIQTDIDANRVLQAGMTPKNRRWQRLQREIEQLETQRDELVDKQTRPQLETLEIPNPLRTVLQGQIEDKKYEIELERGRKEMLTTQVASLSTRSAELNEIYRQLQELDGEVRRANDALDAASQAYFDQRRFVEVITQPEFNPFEVNEYAQAPRRPTEPSVPLIVMLWLAMGLGAGAALSLLLEYGRGAYRGASDVARALSLPVLGTVNRIVTSNEGRRIRARQALVGTATTLLVVTILWVTWAYANRPSLLGSQLTQFIDDVRNDFR